MENVTLEQTHALLEKLAEYVMNQVPTRAEMDKRFEQMDKQFEQVDKQFHEIRQQIDLIRTGQAVFAKTFELHHKRLGILEEQHLGYRVSDKKDKYE